MWPPMGFPSIEEPIVEEPEGAVTDGEESSIDENDGVDDDLCDECEQDEEQEEGQGDEEPEPALATARVQPWAAQPAQPVSAFKSAPSSFKKISCNGVDKMVPYYFIDKAAK